MEVVRPQPGPGISERMNNLHALRRALGQSPDSLPLLLLYANASMDETEFGDARKAFESMLRLDPQNRDAHIGLGKILLLEGKTSEAAIRAEIMLRQDADFAPAHLLLSRVHLSENNHKSALEHFRKAISLDSGLSDPALEHELGHGARPDASSSAQKSPSKKQTDVDQETPFDPDDSDDFRDFWDPQLPPAEKPDLNFSQIGGMNDVKEELMMRLKLPLQHPELFRSYGRRAGGAILLHGPPGCGKSLLARAAAGEMGVNFLQIGPHDIFDVPAGGTGRQIRSLFDHARAHAPCIFLLDDADLLMADRRLARDAGARHVAHQLLLELEELRHDRGGILVLAATNAPWHIDPAFRSPSRLDRVIFVPPPDATARADIIRINAMERPASDLDVAMLASKTEWFSAADIDQLFDLAADEALTVALRGEEIAPINTRALLRLAMNYQPTTFPWFETARHYLEYGNETGVYNDILSYFQSHSQSKR